MIGLAMVLVHGLAAAFSDTYVAGLDNFCKHMTQHDAGVLDDASTLQQVKHFAFISFHRAVCVKRKISHMQMMRLRETEPVQHVAGLLTLWRL